MTVHFYGEGKEPYTGQQGGDDRKILAFALFVGGKYYPHEGARDLFASADTKEELMVLPQVVACETYEWWQIVDTTTLKITDHGDEDGPTMIDGVDQ